VYLVSVKFGGFWFKVNIVQGELSEQRL
jgi:hypothetical protein